MLIWLRSIECISQRKHNGKELYMNFWKMTWILSACWVMLAHAEESIVIDAAALGEPTETATSQTAAPPAATQDAVATPEAQANRERILKGGKMSARERREMARANVAEDNKGQGEAFLAANQAKPGVTVLPSGVQYKVLRASKGKTPGDGNMIVCRYRGTLIDGAVFDKSENKKPSVLRVSTLLPGLKQAVKLMGAGAKWQIVIPPQLAYGEQGNRGVGANAVLVYDMEIVSIR
jgi:FKBP-type peptidyl-prolyl cis-trans isomerase FklB